LPYLGGIDNLRQAVECLNRVSWRLADGALALLLFALTVATAEPGERLVPLSVAIIAFETLPLTFRRRYPAPVFVTIVAASFLHLLAGFHQGFFNTFAAAVAMYSIASCGRRRISLLFLALLPLALPLAVLIDWHNRGQVNLADIPYNFLIFLSAWLLGDNVRTRRAYVGQLEERDRMRLREQGELARRAVADERAAIARELHDIVAHSVSVMVLQANAAERIVLGTPQQALTNIRAIQSTGREAMAEMRRLLAVLRPTKPGSDGENLLPQPSLADLQKLAERTSDAGLKTELAVEGDPSNYPEALQLSAYRVVQEALTNTLRHSSASRADVRLRCSPSGLDLEITDDGRRPQTGADGKGGQGLIGLRERVLVFDGQFEAGPREEGGFRVHAFFPVNGRR
jgi:signal transduction histidine kinase